MLEGLVAWVLNTYVGEYFENLNTEQLSIAIMQGQVELENVPLKQSALRRLDIPLAVKSGILGKLTLSIPLTRARSQPWVLKMSDLLVLLGPTSESKFDVEIDEQAGQSRKEQQLEQLEAFHNRQLSGVSPQQESPSHASWWGASLVSTVVNNIQLILTNVHIRYEDDTTLPNGLPFAFGLRVHKIVVHTTDAAWKPVFVQPQDGRNIFKTLELAGLSVYWNSGQKPSKDINTHRELQNFLAPESMKEANYLLQPFSANVRLEKNGSKFPLKSHPAVPRFKLSICPERAVVELTRSQLAELRAVFREWARFERARHHRKWRPLVTISQNAKEWWRFAYQRILEDARRQRTRHTWHFALTRASHFTAYCRAYRRKLEMALLVKEKVAQEPSASSPTTPPPTLSNEDAILMRQIERDPDYSYHELHLFRETVFRRLMREKDQREGTNGGPEEETFEHVDESAVPNPLDVTNESTEQNQSGGLYGWLSSWFSSSTPESGTKPEGGNLKHEDLLEMWPELKEKDLPPDLKRLEKHLEEEILDVLNESWDDSTILRRDHLLAEVTLILKRLTIRFLDESMGDTTVMRVLAVDLWRVQSQLHLSPRHHTTNISLCVGDLNIQRLRISTPSAPSSPPENYSDENVPNLIVNTGTGMSGDRAQAHRKQPVGMAPSLPTDDQDSLIYGSVEAAQINPELLLSIGKAANVPDNKETPLFRLVYCRSAPRILVRHTLEAKLCPIMIMYDEAAFDGLAALFDSDYVTDDDTELSPNGLLQQLPKQALIELQTHVDLNLHAPEVSVELRSSRTASLSTPSAGGRPFARLHLRDVGVEVKHTELFLTEITVGVGLLDLIDMTDGHASSLLRSPISSANSSGWPLSASCPDLLNLDVKSDGLGIKNSRTRRETIHHPIPGRNLSGRKVSTTETRTGEKPMDNGHSILKITLIDPLHSRFETTFKKATCMIDARLGTVHLGMNRRSWTLLLDQLGLLSPQVVPNEPDEIPTNQTNPNGLATVHLSIDSVRIAMNYPDIQTQLGILLLTDLDVNVSTEANTSALRILLSTGSASLSDCTPFYSEFYSQRLAATLHNQKAVIEIIKYNTPDPDLARPFDMSVELKVSDVNVTYVHTHRYFCALLDFWFHFFQLQDIVVQSNWREQRLQESKPVDDNCNGRGARIQLSVSILGHCCLVFPLNQHSRQAIVAETTSIIIDNRFDMASAIENLVDYCVVIDSGTGEEKQDCLIDWMKVECRGIALYEAILVENDQQKVKIPSQLSKLTGRLDNGNFMRHTVNSLQKPYDLTVNIFRNLDGAFCHNVPDVAIVTTLDDVNVRVTIDFYTLLRGFLEKNLGDALLPVMGAIPAELRNSVFLQTESRTNAIRYPAFAFRMRLSNVQLHCLVPANCPTKSNDPGDQWRPFGIVNLDNSLVTFDAYNDSSAELDLICHSTSLLDSRFDDDSDKKKIFTTILCPINTSNETPRRLMSKGGLMSEAHLLLRNGEPPMLTLVLTDSRVLLMLDWLNDAMNFVLLHTDFEAPPDPLMGSNSIPGKMAAGIAGPGVITRGGSVCPETMEESFKLKITLRNSDLLLLENPDSPASLALIAHTTAVLYMCDPKGALNATLEIQTVNICSCVMSAEIESRCQLSNDFSATIGLADERERYGTEVKSPRTGGLVLDDVKYRLTIEIMQIIAKLSYRDVLAIQHVLDGAVARLKHSLENAFVPVNTLSGPNGQFLVIDRILITGELLSMWLLEDVQNSAFPLVRLNLSGLRFERKLDSYRFAFTVAIDFFNQLVFGWEPLLEPWRIDQLAMNYSKKALSIDLQAGESSPLDITVTQAFVQQALQFSSRWPNIKLSLDRDFRLSCIRSRSDYLPYLLRNETGSNLQFSVDVVAISEARQKQHRTIAKAKWYSIPAGQQSPFEFPVKRLITHDSSNDTHQIIIKVEGWNEVSPVSVDSVGTYFRTAKRANTTTTLEVRSDRIVIVVTMEMDGRKVVTVRSALTVVNRLPDAVELLMESDSALVKPNVVYLVPLRFAMTDMRVKPRGGIDVMASYKIEWQNVKTIGDVSKRLYTFNMKNSANYFMCIAIKREHYPEHETLPGHTIRLLAPLTVLNQLPVDLVIQLNKLPKLVITAAQQLPVTHINTTEMISCSLSTDQFHSMQPVLITCSSSTEQSLIHFRMCDNRGRALDLYGTLTSGRSGAFCLAFWVPYWIVNRSGIPLIIRQEACLDDAAGQMEEHETAKDLNPLMFSFANDGCPQQCSIRAGGQYFAGFTPHYSAKFSLDHRIQAIKLRLTHETQATQVFNLGVEVRAGTGRYKDTQVVIVASRYQLNNLTPLLLYVAHPADVNTKTRAIALEANSSRIWNEHYEDQPELCLKRADAYYWSEPFRIDQINSIHVTTRAHDETPLFVRVEVNLNGAVLCVTFTDASFFPPPIQIENLSNVPILYQQVCENARQHLRTICKAKQTVDYAWDNPYGTQLLTLQVFENKSHEYDPKIQGTRPSLSYENHVHIKLMSSFDGTMASRSGSFTDEHEQVLSVMQNGKVVLNKLNISDSSQLQLWCHAQDGCLENVGMRNRCGPGKRQVLDVFEKAGNTLMLKERDPTRDLYQKWNFLPEGRMVCGVMGKFVEARKSEVILAPCPANALCNNEGVPLQQWWTCQCQRPGSGVLDVECLRRGPTQILRIVDRTEMRRKQYDKKKDTGVDSSTSTIGIAVKPWSLVIEMNVIMPSGIGISLVNGHYEELVYGSLQGITLNAQHRQGSYMLTGNVNLIQIDNAMLNTDRWQMLYCPPTSTDNESSPDLDGKSQLQQSITRLPALRIEMNCMPMEHYDAFDCFRVKLARMSVHLDEILLWKLVAFVQESGASESVQPSALLQPPNLEPTRPDPLAARRCYFGTLDVEFGVINLSVYTVTPSGLPSDLRRLKQQLNVMLVSFQDVALALPPFRQFYYFETFAFLLDTMAKYYAAVFKTWGQTLKIVGRMDAFGNLLGLIDDVKESVPGLFLEADLPGFIAGFGYGVTNSISKVASSMSRGVSTIGGDEWFEQYRRDNGRRQPAIEEGSQSLGQFYSGIKGLGTGLAFALGAIPQHVMKGSQKGLTGAIVGVGTGALATITRPVQGVLDFVDGTASAVKEFVGTPAARQARMASRRTRLPRVTTNLHLLLPYYSDTLARAQQDLLRITGYKNGEVLRDVERCYETTRRNEYTVQQALIGSNECYIVRQVNSDQLYVVQRIAYKQLQELTPIAPANELRAPRTQIDVILEEEGRGRVRGSRISCSREDIAQQLCEKILRAKELYNHTKRTLATISDDYDGQ